MEENNKKSEDINVSLGTTIFIVIATSIAITGLIVWISLKIRGIA